MEKKNIAIIFGTRPDIIKLYPVYEQLKDVSYVNLYTIFSGQQKELGEETLKVFSINPHIRLHMSDLDRQTLFSMDGYLEYALGMQFKLLNIDLIIVHGDVITAFAAVRAAFLQRIPVFHIEAGLRTSTFEEPFPEEGIRRSIAQITSLHFAPTEKAKENLLKENISEDKIFVTGNTVVDSLLSILSKPICIPPEFLEYIEKYKINILVTCHRRDNWGENLEKLCKYMNSLTDIKSIGVIWVGHSNPNVSNTLHTYLNKDKILYLNPLNYKQFISIMDRVDMILTDSGGVIEETSVLNKPTIILRNETERPEALELPHTYIIGNDYNKISYCIEAHMRFEDELLKSKNNKSLLNYQIFGDGTAGEQICNIIEHYLKGI